MKTNNNLKRTVRYRKRKQISQIVDDFELPACVTDGREPHSIILGSLKIAIYLKQ